MSPQLTILVLCVDSIGRFNASSGLTSKLLKRGHRVVYMVPERYQEKLTSLGFEVIACKSGRARPDEKVLGDTLATLLLNTGIIGPSSVLKKMQICVEQFMAKPEAVQGYIRMSEDFDEAIKECKPDLVIIDQFFLPPAVYFSNIPWLKYVSTNPLMEVFSDELPPGGSGYPYDGSNRVEWPIFNKVRYDFVHSKLFNDYVEKIGNQRYPNDEVLPNTQIMTVYGIPDELDYPEIRQLGWHNIEVFNKEEPKDTGDIEKLLPKEFVADTLDGQFSGKWIYLSLGSMCSINLTIMRKLICLLGKTNHKYIVSKGPKHAELVLARNMWGQQYVPQIQTIKFVDLVITHGGNNSITEIFAHGGKPMIVIPMFWDQYDNAQRVHETGYGIRLEAYEFTEAELNDAIQRLLADEQLARKLRAASKRILASNAAEMVCDKLEALLSNNNN